jgi:hypothetical protein
MHITCHKQTARLMGRNLLQMLVGSALSSGCLQCAGHYPIKVGSYLFG